MMHKYAVSSYTLWQYCLYAHDRLLKQACLNPVMLRHYQADRKIIQDVLKLLKKCNILTDFWESLTHNCSKWRNCSTFRMVLRTLRSCIRSPKKQQWSRLPYSLLIHPMCRTCPICGSVCSSYIGLICHHCTPELDLTTNHP